MSVFLTFTPVYNIMTLQIIYISGLEVIEYNLTESQSKKFEELKNERWPWLF